MPMVHHCYSLFTVMDRIHKGEINELYGQSFILYISISLQMEEFLWHQDLLSLCEICSSHDTGSLDCDLVACDTDL